MHSSHDLQPGRRRRSLPPSSCFLSHSPAFSSPTQLTRRLHSTPLDQPPPEQFPPPQASVSRLVRGGAAQRSRHRASLWILSRARSLLIFPLPPRVHTAEWVSQGATFGGQIWGFWICRGEFSSQVVGSCWACFCRGDVVLQPRWNAGGSTAAPSGGELWVKESCCCCVLVSSGGVGVTAREFRARRLSQQLREALCGIVVVEWSGVEGNTVQTWLDIFLEVALGAGLGGEAGMRRSLGM